MTLMQLSRAHGRAAAQLGAHAMVRRAELLPVLETVWVHAATGRLPGWDQPLEAQARWLALDPSLRLQQRVQQARSTSLPIPVIGGNAAYRHWGFGEVPWKAELYVPAESDLLISDDEVDVVVETIDRVDVRWEGSFPYLAPEATLARAFEASGDLDGVAIDLRDAMWRLFPLRPELLSYHLRVVAERNGWEDDRWNGDVLYTRLVSMAGGWPDQPARPHSTVWWDNAAHISRVQRTHPDWLHGPALRAWYDEYRNEPRE
ncbi:hypothetical protein EDF24_1445 [Curtobacterium sp. PhB130]|uniref:hypothetical protein n=1 Tax=Curtobacterium sp. PhB130 TaxID=2485178 RepID=UPI000F4BC70C|nr:hypothetical protein [Curtobacterium sp. PhB130]ROS75872.1 hypothetical protein EDF24_1445 [Curtobacterium sp. PhB130]